MGAHSCQKENECGPRVSYPSSSSFSSSSSSKEEKKEQKKQRRLTEITASTTFLWDLAVTPGVSSILCLALSFLSLKEREGKGEEDGSHLRGLTNSLVLSLFSF